LKAVPVFAFNPGPITGDGNWTWLVPGRIPTLVDAGIGEPRHLDALSEALTGIRLAQVLVTHAHVDHASGAPALHAQFGVTRFRKLPWPERDAWWRVHGDPVHDGEAIPAGDTDLVAVHTPGHSPDHLCFWDESSRTLFGGDLAIKGSSVWIPASHGGNLAAYLGSLERVLALNPARVLPAHGGVIENPAAVLRAYIDHRREREAQIVDALRAGDSSPEAIVKRVYQDLRESLVPLAKESVIAHLLKLQHEGRARVEQEAWTIIDA
jgi:glyoxylase-like metal-dependent hydrolase (beta-lactamase superfamily II)